MKRCRICGQTKGLGDFHKDRSKPDGLCNRCKICNVEHSAKYQKTNPLRRWAYELMRSYGITVEQYNAIAKRQKYRCAVCRGRPTMRGRNLKKLFVDHCHRTGSVRGLLCGNCNAGIGQFRDKPLFLVRAANYLRGAK